MDYSLILASQFIREETSVESEDAFYDAMSFDGFAKLQGAFRKLKASAIQPARAARRIYRTRIGYTQSRSILDS